MNFVAVLVWPSPSRPKFGHFRSKDVASQSRTFIAQDGSGPWWWHRILETPGQSSLLSSHLLPRRVVQLNSRVFSIYLFTICSKRLQMVNFINCTSCIIDVILGFGSDLLWGLRHSLGHNMRQFSRLKVLQRKQSTCLSATWMGKLWTNTSGWQPHWPFHCMNFPLGVRAGKIAKIDTVLCRSKGHLMCVCFFFAKKCPQTSWHNHNSIKWTFVIAVSNM